MPAPKPATTAPDVPTGQCIALDGVSAGEYGASDPFDNSVNGWLGGALLLDVNLADLTITQMISLKVYLQNSADGGETWPPDGSGRLLAEFTTVDKDGHARDTIVL